MGHPWCMHPCNCSPNAHTLILVRNTLLQCDHLFWWYQQQCTGLNMVAAMVSGNVSWHLVGHPSAGSLVLFEEPKGHSGGLVVAWWKQQADLQRLQHWNLFPQLQGLCQGIAGTTALYISRSWVKPNSFFILYLVKLCACVFICERESFILKCDVLCWNCW